MLFRSIIHVENVENLTYIASTKKPGYPHLKIIIKIIIIKKKRQQQPATHWHTHAKENNKKLVFPTLTIPPALGPETLDFSCRLPRGRMVANKKEQGF